METTDGQKGLSDTATTVGELKALAQRFADERDWAQFHGLKNLSMALAIEAGELMEPFQWLTPEQAAGLMDDPTKSRAVEEELADVVIYALQFANRSGIDISAAIERKMAKNVLKYPVSESRGSAEKRS